MFGDGSKEASQGHLPRFKPGEGGPKAQGMRCPVAGGKETNVKTCDAQQRGCWGHWAGQAHDTQQRKSCSPTNPLWGLRRACDQGLWVDARVTGGFCRLCGPGLLCFLHQLQRPL